MGCGSGLLRPQAFRLPSALKSPKIRAISQLRFSTRTMIGDRISVSSSRRIFSPTGSK